MTGAAAGEASPGLPNNAGGGGSMFAAYGRDPKGAAIVAAYCAGAAITGAAGTV